MNTNDLFILGIFYSAILTTFGLALLITKIIPSVADTWGFYLILGLGLLALIVMHRALPEQHDYLR